MTLNSVINLNERQNSCFFYKEMTVNHLKNYFPLEYKFSFAILSAYYKSNKLYLIINVSSNKTNMWIIEQTSINNEINKKNKKKQTVT